MCVNRIAPFIGVTRGVGPPSLPRRTPLPRRGWMMERRRAIRVSRNVVLRDERHAGGPEPRILRSVEHAESGNFRCLELVVPVQARDSPGAVAPERHVDAQRTKEESEGIVVLDRLGQHRGTRLRRCSNPERLWAAIPTVACATPPDGRQIVPFGTRHGPGNPDPPREPRSIQRRPGRPDLVAISIPVRVVGTEWTPTTSTAVRSSRWRSNCTSLTLPCACCCVLGFGT